MGPPGRGKILHTAHRTTTSHAAWERLCGLLDALGYVEVARQKKDEPVEKAYRAFKQYGLESIEIYGMPGKISFRTRSSKGGLGEGFDLLVIDEAQGYAVLLYQRTGGDWEAVRKALNHSDITTTMIYALADQCRRAQEARKSPHNR